MARKDAEKFILKYIDKLMPGSKNVDLYTKMFSRMNDNEFKQFMDDLKHGRKHLVIICPNYSENGLSLKRNLEIAKELGHDFYQYLWYGPTDTMPRYRSLEKFLVYDIPFRRAAQLLVKKIAIPEDNKSVDILTQQPANKSSAAKMTYPEIQMLAAMGVDNALIELLKYRGGDKGGYIALTAMLNNYGMANRAVLDRFSTGVQSTKTLKTYLTGMHLKNTL